MPVVLSYEDLGALGAVAHASGRGQFAAQDQANTNALLANRQQQDTARMQLEIQQQQAEADRRLQDRVFNGEQRLAFDRLDQETQQAQADRLLRERAFNQDNEQFNARLASDQKKAEADRLLRERAFNQENQQFHARLAAQQEQAQLGVRSDVADRLVQAQLQSERDAQQHQYRLAEIEARNTRGADGAPISPEGVPSEQQSEREVRQFGNLIPYEIRDSFGPSDANFRREEATKQAQSFALLPTDQLKAYVAKKSDDKWVPYIRSIIQARQQITGGQGRVGVTPEGTPRGQRPGNPATPTGSLQGSDGFGLSQLNQAELDALASDPEMLRKFFTR